MHVRPCILAYRVAQKGKQTIRAKYHSRTLTYDDSRRMIHASKLLCCLIYFFQIEIKLRYLPYLGLPASYVGLSIVCWFY